MSQTKRVILFAVVVIILGNIYFNGNVNGANLSPGTGFECGGDSLDIELNGKNDALSLSPESALSCGGDPTDIDVPAPDWDDPVQGEGSGGDPTEEGAILKAKEDCKEDIKKNAVLGTFTCSTCPPGKSGCNQEIFEMSDTFLEWSELHCETNEGETSHGVKFWYASCGCGSSGLSGSAEVGCTKCTPKPQRN